MKSIFRLSAGSVQSKVISLLIFASISLSPISAAAFGTGEITIPNPNALTGTGEASRVDGSSGALTQHIPIDIPPGRNDLQPNVSLDYNSQSTQDSIVGYGWSLSVPYIERLNKTGAQDLYGSYPYYSSSIEGELASTTSTIVPAAATTTPTIMDSSFTSHGCDPCSSDSFTYTVPAGGTNKLFVVMLTTPSANTPSATLNGVALQTFVRYSVNPTEYQHWYAVLPNPTSGTFSINLNGGNSMDYDVFTVQNANLTNPTDVNVFNAYSTTHTSMSVTGTTTAGLDLLLSEADNNIAGSITGFGAGETQIELLNPSHLGHNVSRSWKAASASPGAETTSVTTGSSQYGDIGWFSIRAPSQTIATSTSFRPKLDTGSFTSYSLNTTTNTWTVYDKKGTKYTYGSDDTGRMYDTTTGTSTYTYRWYLQEIRDTNGNYIKYTYLRDNNVIYPYRIIYTGNGSTDGIFTISFATSTRPDSRLSYASGFAATTTQRISKITAAVNGTTVRQYDLSYGTGDNGYRSLLTSIQQKGYDDNNTLITLPAMNFTYATSSAQFYAPANRQISGAGCARRWLYRLRFLGYTILKA
jgi:hypothetical protein